MKIDSEAPTSLKIGEHEGEGVFVVVTDDFVLKVADDCFLKLAEVAHMSSINHIWQRNVRSESNSLQCLS